MKGIARKLDYLGRVTLPMEYRKSFEIEVGENAPVGMRLEGNTIELHIKPVVFKGMVRQLDDVGRLTLPKEYRNALGIEDHDLIDMWVEDNFIFIRRLALQCVICTSEDEKNLMEVDEVRVCRTCAIKVIAKFSED